MKPKRRITAMYKKLLKMEHTDEVTLAQDLLAWVLDAREGTFDEIIPGAVEPAPRLAADIYKYGVPQPVWTMRNPFNADEVYITDSIPLYTPRHWWVKQEIDDIEESIIFGEDYLNAVGEFTNTSITWIHASQFFDKYSYLFKSHKEVDKYLSHFFTISQENRLDISAAERREFQTLRNCNSKNLKTLLEKEYNAEFIYMFKEKGERTWVMKKQIK